MAKLWPGKVGTIPAAFYLRYNYRLEVGRIVLYKMQDEMRYNRGRIEQINYFQGEPSWIRLSKV